MWSQLKLFFNLLHPLTGMCPWPNYLISQSLTFYTYKIEIIQQLHYRVIIRNKEMKDVHVSANTRAQEMLALIIVFIHSFTIVTNTWISWTTPAGWFPYAFPNTKPLSWNAVISSHPTGEFLIHNSRLSSSA